MAETLVPLRRRKSAPVLPRPDWLRVAVKNPGAFGEVGALLDGLGLNTVCREARCPNIYECWGQHKTATFMILGDVCTRACRYCSVKSGRPTGPPDAGEPERVAEAVQRLNLLHVVLTSVDRDDLPDKGAGHFVATLQAIHRRVPRAKVEVLIPDFEGKQDALQAVLDARPDILDHNTETVPRLYRRMRSRGIYARTLEVLARAHAYRQRTGAVMRTKTGLMLGLGETMEEVLRVMDDLRAVHCDVLTLGQYLRPTPKHVAIDRYVTPEEFSWLREQAYARGFLHCESGPLVRSSYHAHEHMPKPPLDAAVAAAAAAAASAAVCPTSSMRTVPQH